MKTNYIKNSFNKQWILSGITPEMTNWAEGFGEYLCDLTEDKEGKIKPGKRALTTGQLRRFFGEVKRIESNLEQNRQDIEMLKPMLAYAVGRVSDKTNRIVDFQKELSTAIDTIRRNDKLEHDFNNFVNVFEAIVAYHKFYGGKESNN